MVIHSLSLNRPLFSHWVGPPASAASTTVFQWIPPSLEIETTTSPSHPSFWKFREAWITTPCLTSNVVTGSLPVRRFFPGASTEMLPVFQVAPPLNVVYHSSQHDW